MIAKSYYKCLYGFSMPSALPLRLPPSLSVQLRRQIPVAPAAADAERRGRAARRRRAGPLAYGQFDAGVHDLRAGRRFQVAVVREVAFHSRRREGRELPRSHVPDDPVGQFERERKLERLPFLIPSPYSTKYSAGFDTNTAGPICMPAPLRRPAVASG